MQKQFIFTFLFLAFSFVLPAQISNQKYRKLTEIEKRKLAKKDHNKLYGDIYTLCFFVDTQKDQWTEEEVDYYMGELENSQYWLMEEASIYGAEIKDELTAFLVGWAEEVEDEYLDFRPDRVAAKKEMEERNQQKTKTNELKFSLKRKKEN